MTIFDDPSIKEFMIHVIKRCIGILDAWIANRYQLEKAVICPKCAKKIVIGQDAEFVKNK